MGGGQQSPFVPGGGTFRPYDRYRPSTEDANMNPDDVIMMNFRARIINDILKGKINLDDLQRGEQMGAEDKSLPNLTMFRPIV